MQLFVGNLPFDSTSEDIKALFVDSSCIQAIRLIKRYGRFKGYSFVTFTTPEAAADAILTLNGTDVKGRPLKVQEAQPKPVKVVIKDENAVEEPSTVVKKPKAPKKVKEEEGVEKVVKVREPREKKIRGPDEPLSQTTLFVGNLPFLVEDQDLKDIFEGHPVTSARIVTVRGRSKGFGFVEFSDNKTLMAALEDFQGAQLEGRSLVLKQAYELTPRTTTE